MLGGAPRAITSGEHGPELHRHVCRGWDTVDGRRELEQALDELTHAYQHARAAHYRAGSPQMQDLAQAEQAYRTARQQRELFLAAQWSTRSDVVEPPAERVVDLRDADSLRVWDTTHRQP